MESEREAQIALNAMKERRKDYLKYAEYYDGVHPLAFATDKFLNAFGRLFAAFSLNLCPAVVDALVDRLDLEAFTTEESDGEAVGEEVWRLWQLNRMDRRAGEVHLEAARAGDAYVIVWPDESGVPILYPNRAENCIVQYDAEGPGRVLWAAKSWMQEDRLTRLTLYFPDRIEKYVSVTRRQTINGLPPDRAGSYERYEVPGEGWPLPNPYQQVPVFHLANNAPLGGMGRSELKDVVPLQDAVNKSVADRLVGAEFQALPQRWITGVEVPIDPQTGLPVPLFTPGADRVWALRNELAKFGQFDAADLAALAAETQAYQLNIAQVSRTPLHYLLPMTGDFPSGESLKTAETAFLAKVEDRQVAFGNFWEDMMAFALRVQRNQLDPKTAVRLHAQWTDPAPRSEKEFREMLLLERKLGVSQEEALRKLGYGDEEIRAMVQAANSSPTTEAADRLLATIEEVE